MFFLFVCLFSKTQSKNRGHKTALLPFYFWFGFLEDTAVLLAFLIQTILLSPEPNYFYRNKSLIQSKT